MVLVQQEIDEEDSVHRFYIELPTLSLHTLTDNGIYKDVYVQVAQWIYGRSAQLVAASLTGLIMLLKSYNKDIRKVCLVAEGSLFWSENRKDKNYNILVMEKLRELLQLFGLKDIEVDIKSMNNANLIGTGIAALS